MTTTSTATTTTTSTGRAKARRAGELTRRIGGLREKSARCAQERRRLMLEANRDGVTYTELEDLVGIDASLIAKEIRRAKDE